MGQFHSAGFFASTICGSSKRRTTNKNGMPKARNSSLSSGVKSDVLSLCIPFFAEMDTRNRKKIKKLFSRKKYEREDLICRQGESKFGLFIVISGKVQISAINGGNETKGNEGKSKDQILAIKENGDYFGAFTLSTDKTGFAPVTARALEKCELLQITTKEYEEAVRENPALGIHITSSASDSRVRLSEIPFFKEV
mmetsp:Transcript_21332/g.34384  ORF Transcript_21332/g.34384 Transcript_21332/m.34384 type:complete len:196 (-) Transcript_21332:1917-2504(-)